MRIALALAAVGAACLLGVAASQAALSPQRTAWLRFTAWTAAIESFHGANATYVGMTVPGLLRGNPDLRAYPIRIAWAAEARYCLETTVTRVVYHRVGPLRRITIKTTLRVAAPAGPCPAAPDGASKGNGRGRGGERRSHAPSTPPSTTTTPGPARPRRPR